MGTGWVSFSRRVMRAAGPGMLLVNVSIDGEPLYSGLCVNKGARARDTEEAGLDAAARALWPPPKHPVRSG